MVKNPELRCNIAADATYFYYTKHIVNKIGRHNINIDFKPHV